MTAHLHPEHVEGCYRCDIGRDEATRPRRGNPWPACPTCAARHRPDRACEPEPAYSTDRHDAPFLKKYGGG